jgi:hypothetical protein
MTSIKNIKIVAHLRVVLCQIQTKNYGSCASLFSTSLPPADYGTLYVAESHQP